MKLNLIAKLAVATMALLPATQALAETRITYKSAKSTSSYYQMAVQIAEGMVVEIILSSSYGHTFFERTHL